MSIGIRGHREAMGRGKNLRVVRKVPPPRQGFREPRQNRPRLPHPGVDSPDDEKAMIKHINVSDGLLVSVRKVVESYESDVIQGCSRALEDKTDVDTGKSRLL